MPPKAIIESRDIPTEVIADLEGIRLVNPQRFEMEMLHAVTLFDPTRGLVAGYMDAREDAFWVRGHMPFFALMPGVLLCEAAAQLCSYYAVKANLLRGDFLGFGGLEDVRFRGIVRPGERVWLVGFAEKPDPRRMICQIQAFVNHQMIFHGRFIGVPISQSPRGGAGGTASQE